jgi:hypothetical protein
MPNQEENQNGTAPSLHEYQLEMENIHDFEIELSWLVREYAEHRRLLADFTFWTEFEHSGGPARFLSPQFGSQKRGKNSQHSNERKSKQQVHGAIPLAMVSQKIIG